MEYACGLTGPFAHLWRLFLTRYVQQHPVGKSG